MTPGGPNGIVGFHPEVAMHRIERAVVYVALTVALLAAFGRTRPVGADGAADGTFGIVTARAVRIVGADGTVLATIGGNVSGGMLEWSTKDGKPAGVLATSANGGFAAFRNVDAKETVFVGTATDAKIGVLSVSEAAGARRAVLVGSNAGAANFYNADGKMVAYVGAASDTKAGTVQVNRADGTRGAALAA